MIGICILLQVSLRSYRSGFTGGYDVTPRGSNVNQGSEVKALFVYIPVVKQLGGYSACTHCYIPHYNTMKELPLELWSIIAKLVKRQQPAAGAEANWNDHLNQQDLVSLQRVNKVRQVLSCFTLTK